MDYRYFPEPDLPPLIVDPAEIEAARAALPERPEHRIQRWREAYGLGQDEAQALAQSPGFTDYFETLARASGSGRSAATWMLGEISRTLNERSIGIEAFPLTPIEIAKLLLMTESNTLTFGTAKDLVFPAMLAGEGSAEAIVAQRGLAQVSDRATVATLVNQVLAAQPAQVAQVRAGKESLKGFLVGQVLKAGQGRLNAKLVKELLDEALAKP
jgi:aspartyl-tRNA(Asn)/glutamyl-tRNA(Gln) amidotransferase subunit B